MLREGADKTFYVKPLEKTLKFNVIYEEKLKKHQRYFYYNHFLLRVPENTTDEWIEKYINYNETQWWMEYNLNDSLKTIEHFKQKLKEKEYKLQPQKSTEEFRQIVNKYIEKYTPKFGKPKQVRIKTLRNAWGRCSINKDILTFNPILGYLPEKYIEHVVYHEMIHTYCLNHNPPFYKKMEEVYPDWREYDEDKRVYYYLLCCNEIYDF